jgi:hypothetical protein
MFKQSVALREAIREYEANKWKAIGAKLNKPAKVRPSSLYEINLTSQACEQYAKEHFKSI